jgi:hydroxymethylpyrimidine/phosphomethylpyrimidine kinase
MKPNKQAIVLTIGGSDCSGQAGIQADLRTLAAFDVAAMTAITSVTVQDHERVVDSHPVPPAILGAQVRAVLENFPVGAIKTGMLVSSEHIEAVLAALECRPHCPLVVDPVLRSSSGTPLLDDDGLTRMTEDLFPLATVVTPNLDEALILAGTHSEATLAQQARSIAELTELRATVVIKGGHATDSASSLDFVRLPSGIEFRLTTPRVDASISRGTGCTFASAIAAGLAKGTPIDEAIRDAKRFVSGALQHARPLREGAGPIDHFWELFERPQDRRPARHER